MFFSCHGPHYTLQLPKLWSQVTYCLTPLTSFCHPHYLPCSVGVLFKNSNSRHTVIVGVFKKYQSWGSPPEILIYRSVPRSKHRGLFLKFHRWFWCAVKAGNHCSVCWVLVILPRMTCVPSYLIHQEKLNDQLEEQRQEQALNRYRCEADQLDHWLLSTKATLDIALGSPKEPMDMEAQLVDCQVQKWSQRSMPTSLGRLFKNVSVIGCVES